AAPKFSALSGECGVDSAETERVEHGEHVAAEALHRIGALGHAGSAVTAPVVAHQAKVLRERRNLAIPHVQRGAERIRQHQYGRALLPLDFDVDRAAVGVDYKMVPPSTIFRSVTPLAAYRRSANPEAIPASAMLRRGESAFPIACRRFISGRQNDGEGRWR